jgi:heme-degrading monooxygenase HmoA
MFVVIFRAKMNHLDSEYSQLAQQLRNLALTEFGCLEFYSVSDGLNEIALSYWPDEERIGAWKKCAEHVSAQKLGAARWYESYSVQICSVTQQYHFPVGSD